MIHALRLRNYKALSDVDLGLSPLTVLLGPNASGRTSVLEALSLLTRLASTDPRRALRGVNDVGLLASRGAQGAFEVGMSGTFRGKRGDLAITLASIEDYPFTDTFHVEGAWGDRRAALDGELSRAETEDDSVFLSPLALAVREAHVYRLDPAKLAAPSYSDLRVPELGPDGEGLASVLADMATARPDDFTRVQEAVRSVVPSVTRVRLARARITRGAGEVWGHEIIFDTIGAADLPARFSGDAALIALGVFALLRGGERGRLVLLDPVERGLSPRAYPAFAAQIHAFLADDPRLQIVAVSDAPLLVDHLDAESIRIHARGTDGAVHIRAMALHPDFELVRREVAPGEFWMSVGEEWIMHESVPSRIPTTMPPLPR